MPRNSCYWTRELELELVDFIRKREFIWKPIGNTNHHIQQKYRAYAELAAELGTGFTARSVRDRWVNIRSTFNYNLRKVEKSRQNASSGSNVYVPCWPLWKPLQFLRYGAKNDLMYKDLKTKDDFSQIVISDIKTEIFPDNNVNNEHKNQEKDMNMDYGIRQKGPRTNRPRLRRKPRSKKCVKVLNNLITAMTPVVQERNSYWYFGKHVTERLKAMREIDAQCASREIIDYIADMDSSAMKDS